MGFKHHLGLTCKSVLGLVQIPCIECNVPADPRTLDFNLYAMMSHEMHMVSFDKVVETIKQTRKSLSSFFVEPTKGGLAIHNF